MTLAFSQCLIDFGLSMALTGDQRLENTEMAVNSEQNVKRRGRPPGSKNKKKDTKKVKKAASSFKSSNSLEMAIRQLLSLPLDSDTKIRLIQTTVDAK